jgi:hypothetical protein
MWPILALLLCGTHTHAQVDTGTISGTVKDKTGALVSGARVEITNAGTGKTLAVVTNSDGIYVSLPLFPATYTISVTAEGFDRAVQNVPVSVAQRTVADFTLEVASATESVTVSGQVIAVQTESATLSSLESSARITNLPLNGPNFAQLMGLAPGVMPAQTQTGIAGGSTPITMKRGVTGYAVNGLRLYNNEFLIDGILDNENHNGLGILLFPPEDAIGEFREETSVADAEFGRAGGGVINIAYKSGTEHYHGDVFELLRNSDLDARNFFDPILPPFRRNQFGGSFGGPVIRRKDPKTFFFVDYQGVRTQQGATFISTVPTVLARTGNFSQYPQIIYNPDTQVTLPNGTIERTPFANNTIPSKMIDPVGQNLINLYPLPNRSGIANNFVYAPVTNITENDGDVKVDRNFSNQDSAWVRYSISHTVEFDPGVLPAPAVGGGQPTGTTFSPAEQAVLSESHIFSPETVNLATFGWSRLDLTSHNIDYGQYLANQVGVPGSNVVGNLLTSGLPLFSITGFAPLGENGFNPAILVSNDYQFNDDVTLVRGRHTFKAGFQFIRLQYNAYQSSSLRGSMTFSTAYTSNPAASSGTGLGAADLLLGRPISGSILFLNGGPRGFRRSEVGGYFQDTFKVSSRLTLNLGLRYENFIDWPWSEVDNRMYQFVPAQQTVAQVGTDGIPSSGVYGRNDDFSPRVGLAYQITSKTVYRMAFGTFYCPPTLAITYNLASNPPAAISTAFTNNQFDFAAAQPASAGFYRPATGVIAGAALNALAPYQKTPTVYQWNAAIERELPQSILLTVSYVGTRGNYLESYPNINQPVPGTGAVAPRRPYPLLQTISESENVDNSTYNGLQVSAEHQLAHGLDLLVAYTYSHSEDDASSDFAAPMDTYNPRADWGNSDFNVPNRFVASGIYQLPFRTGNWTGELTRGWQLSGILSVYSGLPFSVTSASNTLNNGATSRANQICSGTLSNPTIAEWFNINCFTAPGPQQWGDSGRNILRGPDTRQLDFSIAKNFPFTEEGSRSLQFRADAFNIFNTPQFNLPNATVGAAGAGTITSAGSPITLQRTSREIQLGLRLFF